MPIYQDGDDVVITSNSEGPDNKGKIYLGDAKTNYIDEKNGDTVLVQDETVTGNRTQIGNLDQTGDQDVTGSVTATEGFIGDVTGDLTGDHVGDSSGTHTGDVVGDVTGDLTGDVEGNVTGDVTGDLYGEYKGTKSSYIDDPSGTSDAEDTEARAVIASILDLLEARGLMDATS